MQQTFKFKVGDIVYCKELSAYWLITEYDIVRWNYKVEGLNRHYDSTLIGAPYADKNCIKVA